jgi:hypothetical protein
MVAGSGGSLRRHRRTHPHASADATHRPQGPIRVPRSAERRPQNGRQAYKIPHDRGKACSALLLSCGERPSVSTNGSPHTATKQMRVARRTYWLSSVSARHSVHKLVTRNKPTSATKYWGRHVWVYIYHGHSVSSALAQRSCCVLCGAACRCAGGCDGRRLRLARRPIGRSAIGARCFVFCVFGIDLTHAGAVRSFAVTRIVRAVRPADVRSHPEQSFSTLFPSRHSSTKHEAALGAPALSWSL